MEYVIVTKNWKSEKISADSPEDALVEFSLKMDGDMGIYFQAIPADQLGAHIETERLKAARALRFDFAKYSLENDYELDEDLANEIAEIACDLYEEGKWGSEYDCIDKAFNDYVNEHQVDEED